MSSGGEGGAHPDRRPRVTAAVRAGGRTLHVDHRPGDADRVPLVLCSGIGTSSTLFDALTARLDPGRPLVLFDAPGIGRSPRPRVPYRMSTLAWSVRAVVDRLGYDRADVLGVSWGGGLAQQYAFQNPRHCRRVVLAATGTGVLMVPAAPQVLLRMATPRRHRDPEYARSIAGEIYGGSARTAGARVADLLHREPRATPVLPYLYQLAAMAGWTSLPLLPLLRQPTLVMVGDDDPIIPEVNGRIMERLLPRGRLHRYRGGHLAVLSEADELAPVIDAFLDGPDPD